MAFFYSITRLAPAHTASQNFHWFVLGLGLAASAVCSIFMLGQPNRPVLQGAHDAFETPLFFQKVSMADRDQAQERHQAVKYLNGVSGESLSTGAQNAVTAELISQHDAQNVSPVIWDELSEGGNCLTVKTKTGEAFSFRILGLHKQAQSLSDSSAERAINLAIAACESRGEFIEKAVIELDAPQPPKASTQARSL